MSEETIDPKLQEKLDRLAELEEKEAKQKRTQNVLTAKTNLRAKWALQNGCPVDKKHAEFYVDLDKKVRDTLSIKEIIEFAESKDDVTNATAHANAMIQKNEGTKAPENQEPSAQFVQ